MKAFAAVLRYEVLLQVRTARFRLAAVLYVVLCATPPLLLLLVFRQQSNETLGATSYLAHTLVVQPLLTTFLAALVAGNRSGAPALSAAWPVFAAAAMSNTGYLARRWLALVTLIVPLTLLPTIVTFAISFAAGIRIFETSAWVGIWTLWILPLAVMVSAYWLGMVMICGGEISALMVTLLGLPVLRGLTNEGLFYLRLTLQSIGDWLGLESFVYWFRTMVFVWRHGQVNSRFAPGFAATEAPTDLIQGVEWLLPRAVQALGGSILVLCIAAGFVRRTRRDLRPRPVPPSHSLRTFLEMLNQQRERYAPDGGLGWRERLTMTLGVVGFGVCLTFALGLQHHFQDLAGQRYRAEMEDAYEPLPAEIHALSWTVRGHLEAGGRVRSEVVGRLGNRGGEPRRELAFSLNPGLRIESCEVASHTVSTERSWDRLRLSVDPPLAVAATIELRFRLAGVPRVMDFFPRRGDYPFVMRFERLRSTRFATDLSDLSRTPVRRAVTARRIALHTTDLAPTPRYTPWTLTRPSEAEDPRAGESLFGRQVPPEITGRKVDLVIDLSAPGGRFLADTCGHASRPNGDRAQLQGSCRTALKDFKIFGGSLVVTSADGEGIGSAAGDVMFAALPAHRELAESYRQALALVAALTDRAWPGMQGLEGLVAIELPPAPNVDLRSEMASWEAPQAELHGQLLTVPERLLISRKPPKPENLVAQLLTRDLRARRRVSEDQEILFDTLFRSLMLRRMGLAQGGAAVSGPPWLPIGLRRPILDAHSENGYIWEHRLPAVLVEIESRVGSDNFYAGIESFLASSSTSPGTIEELFADLEARSDLSLERFYQDHFRGSALPNLRLVDVRAQRLDDHWIVEGKLRNTGTGESICPVVVKTEIAERVLRVRVDSESASPFSVRLGTRPHTVVLDPKQTCYRWQTKTSSALERINLLR